MTTSADAGESSVRLETTDGCTLDADLFVPAAPTAAVVLCHPHPLYGGDRHNSVVDAVWRLLRAHGSSAVVRFDFRGVRRSTGTHGKGEAERLDVAAAIDRLAPAAPGAPVFLVGYSFGSMVCSQVVDPRVAGWMLIAPPLVMAPSAPACASDPRPKLVLLGSHDQFTPIEEGQAKVAAWTNAEFVALPSADHFLLGHLSAVADRALGFVSR